jgi:hypothetical protein
VIRSFHSIGNELKLESGAILARLLRRDKQFALKELKLIDSKMSPSVSEQLLEVVAQKCSL